MKEWQAGEAPWEIQDHSLFQTSLTEIIRGVVIYFLMRQLDKATAIDEELKDLKLRFELLGIYWKLIHRGRQKSVLRNFPVGDPQK
jgi:hypothetical protein